MSAQGGRQLLVGVAALLLAGSCPTVANAAGPSGPVGSTARQDAQTIEIEVVGDVVAGRPTEVVIRATNPAQDASQGSITVSLPGNPNVEIVGASAPGAKLFQPGEQMFNFGAGRQAPIQVRAAELFVSSWPPGTRHELRLRLTAPGPYALQARASFRRSNGSFLHLPANGQPDQQGAPTRLLDMAPRQAVPPTATPAPPTPTRPPPTATVAPPTATVAPPTATVAPPTTTAPPPTQAAVPPSDKPVAQMPTLPAPEPPATTPPTRPVPPPPVLGPVGSEGSAPTPTAGASGTSSQGGPSMPLLLAGVGIIAVGVAVGLLALVLLLRRRSPAPARTGWPAPSGPYGGPGFAPGGTARMPAAPTGRQGEQSFGEAGYAGAPSWSQPSRGPGGPPPTWPAPPVAHDPPGAAPPPWEWPAAPASQTEAQGDQGQPLPIRPVTLGASSDRPDDPPTVESPTVAGTRQDYEVTPHNDRYIDRTLVGRGGMGSVYRAYDSRLRRWVALKIMHADLGLQPGFVDRFIREAQVAAMLEHPNIVTVYDVELVGDSIQMVMSWIEGQDLQQILEREGALPPVRAALLLGQIAAALDHAHLRERPVLHRDIKPSNIMIGPNDRVILTDFGIARLMGDVSLTQTGQMVGTPAYMAPEVVQGEEADGRADVYALGVVLYQMLTGQSPFRAQTPLALLHAHVNTPPPPPRTVVPTLPPGVDDVLARALAKDPNQRFQSAGALARALRSVLGLA